MCLETHSTVRVLLLWPVTDTPTDGMSTVTWQVYWPASDVLTGSRAWVRDGQEPLATSLLLGATHWVWGLLSGREPLTQCTPEPVGLQQNLISCL